ncbi:cyclin-like protein [Tribonema minus]|uniref:Cyclin-like protein n=1 Tax=Tribonema minus TaxID=303371 RepID=A0A836CHW6_9STRA|nr:cyclin-like protein [Tribonema minus]
MEEQPYINARMRAILVDWLVEVHMRFRLVPDTLYLAIYALDRYLAAATVAREGLQVAGVAALLLASKYEEIYPPEMCDLVYVTDRACAREAILAAERDMLARLEFRLTVPTVYCFLLRYLKAAHADRCIVQLACYISERMLLEARMLRHLPSVAASAAVYLSRRACNRNAWSPTLARYTGYNVAALTPCLRDICEAMRRPCDLRASKRKFGTREFGAVSSLDVDWTV